MPLYVLDKNLWFPPAFETDKDGLLAIGGDLGEERLLLAYKNGIFPWFEDEIPLWWCPDPRFVLFPGELHISKSMKSVLKKNIFQFTVNKDFTSVINYCQQADREGQQGTWITEEMKSAYINLYKKGYAHSAEAWQNGELVGGLYGIRLGKVFFGESMFSHKSNAGKFAFINYIAELKKQEVELIDCQVYTTHLESLGAKMIDRKEFLFLVKKYI